MSARKPEDKEASLQRLAAAQRAYVAFAIEENYDRPSDRNRPQAQDPTTKSSFRLKFYHVDRDGEFDLPQQLTDAASAKDGYEERIDFSLTQDYPHIHGTIWRDGGIAVLHRYDLDQYEDSGGIATLSVKGYAGDTDVLSLKISKWLLEISKSAVSGRYSDREVDDTLRALYESYRHLPSKDQRTLSQDIADIARQGVSSTNLLRQVLSVRLMEYVSPEVGAHELAGLLSKLPREGEIGHKSFEEALTGILIRIGDEAVAHTHKVAAGEALAQTRFKFDEKEEKTNTIVRAARYLKPFIKMARDRKVADGRARTLEQRQTRHTKRKPTL